MNVVLFAGGKSGEHEISLVSCAAVARAISSAHQVRLITISKSGRWYLEEASVLEELRANPAATLAVHENPAAEVKVSFALGKDKAFFARGGYIPCDVAFAVLHGTYGEDGTIQGVFEMAGVPYAGCGVLSSSVAMDKESAKLVLQSAGLPVVPFVCIRRCDAAHLDEALAGAAEKLGFPLFVKPCAAGSSDGAARAVNSEELAAAAAEAFTWDDKILVEKAIDAREIECSVTGCAVTEDAGSPCTRVRAYGPGEIVPTHGFYDWDAKYTDPDGALLQVPAHLPPDVIATIKELAVKAYRAISASGLARVDFFVDKGTGAIYLNEINTMPGFTSISMFPKLCAAEGLGFTQLVDLLLEQAVATFQAKTRLRTQR